MRRRQAKRRGHFAPATQKLWHVRQFARRFSRSPDRLGPNEIHEYQVHLLDSGGGYGKLQQCVSALFFLAEFPTREQLLRFLDAIPNVKRRAILTTG